MSRDDCPRCERCGSECLALLNCDPEGEGLAWFCEECLRDIECEIGADLSELIANFRPNPAPLWYVHCAVSPRGPFYTVNFRSRRSAQRFAKRARDNGESARIQVKP